MDIRALQRQGLGYAEIGRLAGRDWRTVKRYLLVEQQRGSLVWRWFARADDSDQRPLTGCPHCAALLPMSRAGDLAQRA